MPKNNIFESEDYLSIIYSDSRRPYSDYPLKLAKHLRDHFFGSTGHLLDIGCGRGDILHSLANVGFSVVGTDLSPASAESASPHEVRICDLEKDELPFENDRFDFLFSKSVIEHLANPMKCLIEMNRVVRPGGKVVLMTPSWMHTSWGPFYADYTHVTPFTIPSLEDAMVLSGFEKVSVTYFYQLPFLWSFPWIMPLVKLVSLLSIPYSPMYNIRLPNNLNKLIRFSREAMLIGVGHKPNFPTNIEQL